MVYLLHRENYFKIFPIPDAAFDVNSPSNSYAIIAEVYAKYVHFAKYIEDKYKNFNPEEENTITALPQPEVANKYMPESANINSETRLVKDIIDSKFKDKYDNILKILSNNNPLREVVKKFPKASQIELTSYKGDLSGFKKKMIYRTENEKVFVDKSYDSLKTFLVYLFAYMITMEWMTVYESDGITSRSDKITCQIIGNTFFDKDDVNENIMLDRGQLNGIKNLLKVKGHTDEKNYYLKFINIIVSNN